MKSRNVLTWRHLVVHYRRRYGVVCRVVWYMLRSQLQVPATSGPSRVLRNMTHGTELFHLYLKIGDLYVYLYHHFSEAVVSWFGLLSLLHSLVPHRASCSFFTSVSTDGVYPVSFSDNVSCRIIGLQVCWWHIYSFVCLISHLPLSDGCSQRGSK